MLEATKKMIDGIVSRCDEVKFDEIKVGMTALNANNGCWMDVIYKNRLLVVLKYISRFEGEPIDEYITVSIPEIEYSDSKIYFSKEFTGDDICPIDLNSLHNK